VCRNRLPGRKGGKTAGRSSSDEGNPKVIIVEGGRVGAQVLIKYVWGPRWCYLG